jgi:endogenous inhibitor of DNA gyrase (YacG/DUF329 family)
MPGQRAEWPEFPFCSARCRKIDLGRWLGEQYRFSSASSPDEDDPSEDGKDAD